mmetsp:Transcript_71784/g.166036  ORF Transcript_71784/g.166036 Transcript_71784/m.166036 type:complete len:558 (-) Transcript_71784:129-1802(-)
MPVQRLAPAPGTKPELLKDPCNDRPVKDVPCPPAQVLSGEVVFDKKGNPDLSVLMNHLTLEGLLSRELLLDLVRKAQNLFHGEPNMLKLNDPITIVGDIHGQYYDLIKLFEVGGGPGDTQYLFLGDYVDRGSFSIEVVALLYATKIRYPKRVRMLRGNHECRQMTSFFNFREECEYKYDIGVYDAIMDSFDTLPLAATINGKFLAVHGGLSPELLFIRAINNIDRFQEPPREGLLCDLLWSDPLEPKEGEKESAIRRRAPFVHNEVRGCSYFFSLDGAVKFLQKNSLLSVIRAHEAQLEGYKMHKTNPQTGFPAVITIFSAPNYCDVYNNKGAVLKFTNSTLNILQFNCSPHPYHLPNFMDVFAWSMPFVIEKVTEMLFDILQQSSPDKDDELEEPELPPLPEALVKVYRASLSEDQNSAVALASRLQSQLQTGNSSSSHSSSTPTPANAASPSGEEARRILRKKVRTVARIARMFKTLRQENETVIRLKGVCPGHKLKPGLLLAGKDRLRTELDLFSHAHDIDAVNEMRPGQRPSGSEERDFAESLEEDDNEVVAV